ncbi:MAG: glycosyltransferase family 1 protein [Rhizobiales bacterium]|nr:glycosyltransferase family 1 protein [Hyphomicrobiales bacterium]
MKIVFVYWGYENAGSMLDLRGYARAAKSLGHEVTIYGPANAAFQLEYSQELEGADAVVFVFEWTTQLQFGDRLDWVRLIESVPRSRRVVIDCDGAYNEKLDFRGDYNHKSDDLSREWIEICDSLSDKICQPTLRPKRPNVRPFLFHIYDPTWESELDFSNKEFSMIYVGHTKFRWHGMSQVLKAIEPVREQVGRVGLVGEGWDHPIEWTEYKEIAADYYVDREWLRKNKFEAHPAIPFPQVTETINKGVFNPVIYRPLFEHLDFVTCRTFETPAAGTIPLFLLDPRYVAETFGESALELMLGEGDRAAKILDVLARPEHYAGIVQGIRADFAKRHSPEARLNRLIEIIRE